MKALTVYECEHCKKLFRTPDRHQCKFRPELRNCFTCKNFTCWKESTEGEEIHTDEGIYFSPNPNYPDCEYCGPGEGLDIEEIKEMDYNMQCEGWEAKT